MHLVDMSLPPSSLARSTAGNVPPTQNTSPVIKFRCLFTHDLRRKAKRWQDGFLKFHTFNKRAMVYDDVGNFIGDHHWRDSSEIQDGDELELDKGVLIQVGECMEKTQTDLSALFEKKRASQESPTQPRTPAPPSSRASMSSQAGPLKSLNDLLGIKKPSIGRSIVPSSPYEQRHPPAARIERPERNEPPAKRQKQASTGDILQRKSTNEPLRPRPTVIDLEKPIEEASFARPVLKYIASSDRNIGAKSHEKIGSSSTTPKTTAYGASSGVQAATTRDSPIRIDHMKRNPSAPPKTTPQKSMNPPESETHPSTSRSAMDKNSMSEVSRPKSKVSDVPANPLRMLSEKPRQKLMYRALLPPNAPNKAGAGSAESQTTRPASSSNSAVEQEPVICANAEFAISDSTLALFDELKDNGPTAKTSTIAPAPRPPKESPTQVATGALYQIPSHSAVYGPLASSAGIELETGTIPPPSSQRQITQNITRPVPTGKATLLRSHSMIAEEPRPADPTVEVPLAEPSMAPVPAVAAKRNEPKLFRKSLSDPTALRIRDGNNHRPARPLATNGPPKTSSSDDENTSERGPWTSEALDLFDWWPPGRAKPS